jgi:tetratricopeptide (TPR) repeat protein
MRWLCLVFTYVSIDAQISLPAQKDQGLAAGGPVDRSFVQRVEEVATSYQMEGYDLKAERVLQQAIALAEPVDVPAARQLTEALGQHYQQVQQSVKAARVFARLLDDVRKHPEDVNVRIDVLNAYGLVKDGMGNLAEAETLFKELNGLKRDPKQPDGVISGNPLAEFYARHGRTVDAEHVLQQALDDKSGTPAHHNAAIHEYLSFLDRYEEAAAGHKQQSAEILQQIVDKTASLKGTASPKLPEAIINRRGRSNEHSQDPQIWDYIRHADVAIGRGEFDQAMSDITTALTLAAQHPPLILEQTAQIMQLVPQLVSRNRRDDAIQVLRESARVMEQGAPADHPRLAQALARLAPIYESLGWTVEFERVIDRVESILAAAKGPDSPGLDLADELRMTLDVSLGDHRAAVRVSQKMLARAEAAQGVNSETAMDELREVADALEQAGDWPGAEAAWQDLLERSERGNGTRTAEHGQLVGELAQAYARQHMYDKALDLYARAIEILKAVPDGAQEAADLEKERESIEADRADTAGGPPESQPPPTRKWGWNFL